MPVRSSVRPRGSSTRASTSRSKLGCKTCKSVCPSPFQYRSYNAHPIIESGESNVEKKSLVVSDAPVQAASVTTKVQVLARLHYSFLRILIHYHQTQYGESAALSPTTSNTPQRRLVVNWMLIFGALLFHRFAEVNLQCGMP